MLSVREEAVAGYIPHSYQHHFTVQKRCTYAHDLTELHNLLKESSSVIHRFRVQGQCLKRREKKSLHCLLQTYNQHCRGKQLLNVFSGNSSVCIGERRRTASLPDAVVTIAVQLKLCVVERVYPKLILQHFVHVLIQHHDELPEHGISKIDEFDVKTG